MQSERAIVVSRQWATILASLFVMLTGAIASYAFAATAQIAVLQQDVNDLKSARLDVRLARMEEKLDWLVQTQRKMR